MNLGYNDEAEKVVREGLGFSPGENEKTKKHLFVLHTMMGGILEGKGNISGAVTEYETARKMCDPCNEAGQQLAYFNLGSAYASVNPPRKNEAISQLAKFQKIVCKGPAAARYADQCAQAQQYASKLGGSIQ
jgi:hypothetical protein